ncbi:WhiB family transcriptional regulator [Saccharothrix longispora]|uniref:WhiB family transcriptional regulator n=1 Tax=Saccharothrix longispora TaxID=33920 RepID=UPI0028FCFE55|nr:WhiB family transcriptional regulator [Saccharothrix longispora]MBY8851193.1 WhiB family transcriptional regulator [Saccharothrix sp. MB29]MDU0290731.1 WhiB family transcriptional regulator [Saccharothrix longispora]
MNHTDHPGYTGHRALMLALFGPSGRPAEWRADAACADSAPGLFFDSGSTAAALEVCAGCPVLDACRADNTAWESVTRSRRFYASGVVGGQTASARNQTYYPRTTREQSRKDVA